MPKYATISKKLSFANRAANFITKLKYIHGTKYTADIADYKSCREIIAIQCEEHGEFFVKSEYVLKTKVPCQHCRKQNIINGVLETFHNRTEKFEGKFDYSKINLEDLVARKPIEILCKVHGSFFTLAKTHVESIHGCRKCMKEFVKPKPKAKPVIDLTYLKNKNPLTKWNNMSEMDELDKIDKLIKEKLIELKELVAQKVEILSSDKFENKRLQDITKLL